MIVRLPHPSARQVTVMGVPIRLHATPGAVSTAPPRLGQHTDEVLGTLLKYPGGRIDALRREGVIA